MLRAWALALACLFSLIAFNANAANDFAEEKIVLQISDNNPFKQTLVLNVANNLIKHYGPDRVAIEVVAFGPGLRLLFKDNANTSRIQSLVGNGVRFSACSNTVTNMGKKLGHPPELNSNAVTVSAGVVRILELQKKGYSLVKP
ncbi:MAG: DsrE family protein [Thiohalophilus sp.]|jgi:intracellular sulfur oxidation DsrE/DsrF family protein